MSNGVLYGTSHDIMVYHDRVYHGVSSCLMVCFMVRASHDIMVYHDRVYHGVSSCLMVCFMVRPMISWCIMIVCIMVSHHV